MRFCCYYPHLFVAIVIIFAFYPIFNSCYCNACSFSFGIAVESINYSSNCRYWIGFLDLSLCIHQRAKEEYVTLLNLSNERDLFLLWACIFMFDSKQIHLGCSSQILKYIPENFMSVQAHKKAPISKSNIFLQDRPDGKPTD